MKHNEITKERLDKIRHTLKKYSQRFPLMPTQDEIKKTKVLLASLVSQIIQEKQRQLTGVQNAG